MQKSDECGEAGWKFERTCGKQKQRKELQSQGETVAAEGAIEDTNIWSSEKCGGANVLGKMHTEKDRGEKLVYFRNYYKVQTRRGEIQEKKEH